MIHNTGQQEGKGCSDIQDQILKLFEEGGKFDDSPDIIGHLSQCAECRHLQSSIASMENRYRESPERGLRPNPAIQKNIVRYLDLQTSMRSGKNETALDWVKSIFTFRIPVYQALSGLAVLLVLFIFLSGVRSSLGIWWMEIDYSAKSEEYQNADLYVLDTLHLLNTENGQNALEDSILIGFLESSL